MEFTLTGTQLRQFVAKAAIRSYEATGIRTGAAMRTLRADPAEVVVLPSLRRLEVIASEGDLEHIDTGLLAELSSSGLDVWLVVPLSEIASAHASCRNVVTRIQPWWFESDKLKFGSPRLP